MPHVDDGMLHAYLDGALDALYDAGALPDALTPADVVAHLHTCADCRARLEIERGTRAEAGVLLRAAAGPPVDVPPFAEIDDVVRASRRTRRWLPYAWAASLVMAVGAGWWGSQLARDTNVTSNESAAQLPADRPGMRADAPAPAPAEPMADTPAPAALQATRAADAVESARASGAGAAQVAVGEKQMNTRARDIAAARDSVGKVSGMVAGVVGPTDSIRVSARIDPIVITGAVTPLVTTGAATPPVQRLGPPVQEQRIVTIPPPQRALAAQAAAPPAAPTPPLRAEMQRFTNVDFLSMALRVARDSTIPWRVLSAAERRNVRAIAVEAAIVPVIDVKEAPGGGALVRVRQLLRGGAAVELLQWTELSTLAFADSQAREAELGPLSGTVMDESTTDGVPHVVVLVEGIGRFIVIRSTAPDLRTLAERLVIVR